MRIGTTVAVGYLLLAGTARSENWLQRYHDAQHTSFINASVDRLNRIVFDYIFDPKQVDVGLSDILVHYTDPKIEDNGDLVVPFVDRIGSTPTWQVKKIHNSRVVWEFISDYVRQPSSAWEPVFDFAINGTTVYAMGAYGCVWLLNESDGSIQGKKCATDPVDPTGENIWIVSPFTVDGNGNVFFTVRSNSTLIGSSLVKLDTMGNITTASFAALGGAGQIAANNAAVAISSDNNTIYAASTLSTQSGGKLIAMDQSFTVQWVAPLNPGGSCGEARLNDSGTSSPVALPDGGAAIGGWNSSPVSEGWYYSFDSSGSLRGCYPFGWDDTMGVITLNNVTYLVGKHNHYTASPVPYYEVAVLNASTMNKVYSVCEPSTAAACNNAAANIRPISADNAEWCIDAPTLFKETDKTGNELGWVVVPSEEGKLYRFKMFSDPVEETHVVVGGHQNAAYVPTVSAGGAAYTINHGHLKGVAQ